MACQSSVSTLDSEVKVQLDTLQISNERSVASWIVSSDGKTQDGLIGINSGLFILKNDTLSKGQFSIGSSDASQEVDSVVADMLISVSFDVNKFSVLGDSIFTDASILINNSNYTLPLTIIKNDKEHSLGFSIPYQKIRDTVDLSVLLLPAQ
ncbi:MAG: hypothetical protein JXQ90_09215 [Cyclobacteriaceae bacterium]